MNFGQFIKQKKWFMLSQSLITLFFLFILSFFQVNIEIMFMIFLGMLILTLISIYAEYYHKQKYYQRVYQDLEHLEQKRLLSDMITSPDFAEGMILYDILRQTNKYTNDEIAAYQKQQEEYRQYVETWIHEIKTPIAAAKMICDNADFAQKKAVANELRNIESFVEQALYYAKSTNVEKDYIIRKCNLLTLVKAAVKNHASQLILVHCTPSFNNLDHTVYTDHKWLEFILGQLIVNSIKYRQDPMQLAFSAEVKADHIILKIQDNGIGIPDQDLGKIFEKGFTGINGRKYGRSTGMGLYLCKVLAEKMNLKISVESQEKEGTLFKIFFPQNKFMLLEESR